MGQTARFKLGCKVGVLESITLGFVDHDVALNRGHLAPNLPTFGPPCQTVAGRAVMLNDKNWSPSSTGLTLQHRNAVNCLLKRLVDEGLTVHSSSVGNNCQIHTYNE